MTSLGQAGAGRGAGRACRLSLLCTRAHVVIPRGVHVGHALEWLVVVELAERGAVVVVVILVGVGCRCSGERGRPLLGGTHPHRTTQLAAAAAGAQCWQRLPVPIANALLPFINHSRGQIMSTSCNRSQSVFRRQMGSPCTLCRAAASLHRRAS